MSGGCHNKITGSVFVFVLSVHLRGLVRVWHNLPGASYANGVTYLFCFLTRMTCLFFEFSLLVVGSSISDKYLRTPKLHHRSP